MLNQNDKTICLMKNVCLYKAELKGCLWKMGGSTYNNTTNDFFGFNFEKYL